MWLADVISKQETIFWDLDHLVIDNIIYHHIIMIHIYQHQHISFLRTLRFEWTLSLFWNKHCSHSWFKYRFSSVRACELACVNKHDLIGFDNERTVKATRTNRQTGYTRFLCHGDASLRLSEISIQYNIRQHYSQPETVCFSAHFTGSDWHYISLILDGYRSPRSDRNYI